MIIKDEYPKVAIVTPLKNELANIPFLMDSIKNQTMPIEYWIIVENGSDDGSKELLAKLSQVSNVNKFIVLNFTLPVEKYELGFKYSTVVNQGFEYLKRTGALQELDFLGILDADCFPSNHYYHQLTSFMNKEQKLGISSGYGITLEGKHDGEAKEWVRGNCRLWKKKCFEDAGYLVGPSADTLSLAKAIIKGWLAKPDPTLLYKTREVGQKVNYSYYGYSAYYRGIGPMYAFLKSINYIFQGRFKQAKGYCSGYFSSLFSSKPRINDPEIRVYFSSYFSKKIRN